MDRPPIDADALRRALGPRWARVDVVDVAQSTNAELVADRDAPDRAVLVAEEQRAGRGRLDRTWQSPPRAGLLFSVALRPVAPTSAWGWLPLLTGIAVCEALEAEAGVRAVLKWPNDVLAAASEAKLAGILAQTGPAGVVVGVGLNVSTTAAELPVDTATSLALCGASVLDRTRLLVAVLRRLDERVVQWEATGGTAADTDLLAVYRRSCVTLGRDVRVTTTDGASTLGRALDIDGDGRLLVESGDGVRVIGAGDVLHLRPAD